MLINEKGFVSMIYAYQSFLCRFQWVQNDNHPTWIVSSQSTQTGEQQVFSSLEGFIQFLQAEFGTCNDGEGLAVEFSPQDKNSQSPQE